MLKNDEQCLDQVDGRPGSDCEALIPTSNRMTDNGSDSSQEFLCIQNIMDEMLQQVERQPYTTGEVHAAAKSCSRSPQHQPDVGASTVLDEEPKATTAEPVDSDHIPLSCPVFQNSREDLLSETEKSFLVFLDDMRSLKTKVKDVRTREDGRPLSRLGTKKLRLAPVEEMAGVCHGRTSSPVHDEPFEQASLDSRDTRPDQLNPQRDGHEVRVILPPEMKLFSPPSRSQHSLATCTATHDMLEVELSPKSGGGEQFKAMDVVEDNVVACEPTTEETYACDSGASSDSGTTRVLNGVHRDGGCTDIQLAAEGSPEDEFVITDEEAENMLSSGRNSQTGMDADPREADGVILGSLTDDSKNSTIANHSDSSCYLQTFGVGQTTRNEHDAIGGVASARQNSAQEISVCETEMNTADDLSRNLNVVMYRGDPAPESPIDIDCDVLKNDEQCVDQVDGRPGSDCEATAQKVNQKAVHSDYTNVKQVFEHHGMNQGDQQSSDEDDYPGSIPGFERMNDVARVNTDRAQGEQICQHLEMSVTEKHIFDETCRARSNPKDSPIGVRVYHYTNENQAGFTPDAEKEDELVSGESGFNQSAARDVSGSDSATKQPGNEGNKTVRIGDTADDQIDERGYASAKLSADDGVRAVSPREQHHSLLRPPAGERQPASAEDSEAREVPVFEINWQAVDTQAPFTSPFLAEEPRSQGVTDSSPEHVFVTCSDFTGRDTQIVVDQLVPDEEDLVPDQLTALPDMQRIEPAAEESFYNDEDEQLKGRHALGLC